MEALFIESERIIKEGMDFKALRAEGVRLLQKFSGNFWSDYNEHDPGITILEQLCYALTELSYRADFSVADLLVDATGKINEDEQLLYSADEILPSSALTTNDYRKVIFDNIKKIRNIWIEPMHSEGNMLRGLYKILLDVPEQSQEYEEDIKKRVHEIFCQNRTLGEDVEQIKTLKFLPITVHASIEVNEDNDLESILAEIYHNIRNYFSPEPKFYSLEKLLEEGLNFNQIFEGALLKNGFIKESELEERIKIILISDSVKLLMKVKGILNVKDLVLKTVDQESSSEIILPEYTLPLLQIDEDSGIFFSKSGIAYKPDMKIVHSKLQDLTSMHQRVDGSEQQGIDLPKGTPYDFAQYYSIQNDFPRIYGINQEGLPESESLERKGQAKQLKGYLLVFEQIMANYFAQLAHLRDLYSIRKIRKTYFFQPLRDIPRIDELYEPDYEQQLEELGKWQDNFLERRHQFLDYLLSVYGETFTQYSLSKSNPYLSKEDFDEYLLENKLIFLNFIRSINKNRGKAHDYLKEITEYNVVSGLEVKMMIFLGIRKGLKIDENGQWGYKEYSLLAVFQEYNLQISENLPFEISDLNPEKIEQEFEFVFEEHHLAKENSEQENKELLEKAGILQNQTITEVFLRTGLQLDNYKIGKLEDKFVLVFKSEQNWLHIGEFESHEDVEKTVSALRNVLKNLNQASEGLQLIEHILLRPSFDAKKFGFEFRNENQEVLLEFSEQYDFETRFELIKKIAQYLPSKDKYFVEKGSAQEYYIVFYNDNDFSLRGKTVFTNVFEARTRIDQICNYFSNYEHDLADALFLYVRWSEESDKIPEDFYSFKLSVFFPTWTARFFNVEFRSLVEETLAINTPANLLIDNCCWLNPSQMSDYEQLYYAWIAEKTLPQTEQTQIEKLNLDLSMWLINVKNLHR